jgi:hypothetical protein
MQCSSTACGLPFMVSGGRTGPMIDSEEIECPHCRHVCGSERIADVFHTRKLTDDEQALYDKGKL